MAQPDRSADLTGRSQSAAAVLAFGLALGVILALVLLYVAAADRRNRLVAAERQNLALTVGAQRLVWLELRNLERAMAGIAGDARRVAATAPQHALPLMAESISDVAARQNELEGIVLTDRAGTALIPGRGDPALPQWSGMRAPASAGPMRLGPLEHHGGGWLLPLAVRMDDERWIVARLHAEELQRLVQDLDTARTRVIRVREPGGRIVADSRGAPIIGRIDDAPPTPDPGAAYRVDPEQVDRIDGIERSTVSGTVPDYPLYVDVGIARAQVMAPWWRLAIAGAALYALYLIGLAYLVHVLRRHARRREALVQRVSETAEGLRRAQELGRTGTWTATRDGAITWAGPVATLMGVDKEGTTASGEDFYNLMHPDDRERVAERFSEAWRSGQPFSIDYRIVGDDGELRWMSVRGASTAGGEETTRMAGTVVDITERMQAQQQVADAERQFRMLFERNPLPFWVFDVQTLRFLEVNRAAIEQYGYTREEFLAMTILDIRPPEFHGDVMEDLDAHRLASAENVRVWLHRRRNGSLLEVRVYATDIEMDGRAARLVLAEDVTELMAQQRELAYRASHDMVSGLLNADALAHRIDTMRPAEGRIACVQLRGLELIEDSLGREAGHETLRAMATRIARLGERYGASGHVRGDEFALLVCPAEAWPQALEQLQQELGRPIPGEDTLQRLEAWIGVAVVHTGAGDAAQALGNAGLAAHVARTEHRPVVMFEEGMARHASDRLHMASRVHRAIDTHEFELHYQILWDMALARPTGLETLIRWPQREGGYVPPSEFIGLCEDTGLIVPLGRWTLREAAAAQRTLADAGFGDLSVAVNVSLMQFIDGNVAADIEQVLSEFELQRGSLHIELTESVLMTRPEQALETLRTLQRHGVCISLDDFGTGFSSMSYLKLLPLDAIKIDRSFVRDVHHDERNASICEALLALGHGLGLKVIGEGVETQEQFEWLRQRRCDQVQGYGIHRPAPLQDTIAQLRQMQTRADGPWRASGARR